MKQNTVFHYTLWYTLGIPKDIKFEFKRSKFTFGFRQASLYLGPFYASNEKNTSSRHHGRSKLIFCGAWEKSATSELLVKALIITGMRGRICV